MTCEATSDNVTFHKPEMACRFVCHFMVYKQLMGEVFTNLTKKTDHTKYSELEGPTRIIDSNF